MGEILPRILQLYEKSNFVSLLLETDKTYEHLNECWNFHRLFGVSYYSENTIERKQINKLFDSYSAGTFAMLKNWIWEVYRKI